ncbi:SDR family oxidoreductase [Nocardioides sp. MAH-18]|uniref:2-C-methyl-D-erythritol 4-phosphate cytidylyltransferase n=1 Tax=Nocardioides agri TaxID=2682843 RepID=A0A6L6XTT3_9ACTN|nr:MULTISPECIES: bifunctional cytidylyltransferase/SDR family oxidoreductase [unclassified Nocardioides]MBA2955568.1 bifunctional cytidylyltransferase/SDR family oxidoreductase [Nocardioides sp. CGMCC 1.13656]MVQ50418.1 SDR family oxidoreductase [Nocardioides sp. MAH-18]
MKNVAVLLAGGVGVRVGLGVPKQLIKIAGHSIMEHTLAILDRHADVDEIVVMMAPGHLDAVHKMVRDGGYAKVTQILEGAGTRNDTTQRALDALGDEDCKVLLHDAVRPLVSARIITDCFAALDEYAAVDVAIPSADTIIEVGPDNTIRDIPPRANLRRGQTPQAFRLSTIRDAYRIARQDPAFEATDDCTVVLRYQPDVPIWVVPGDERNMKVTEPIDIYLADKLFQLTGNDAPAVRSDDAMRAALSGKTVVVFGGSYGIGADIAELAASYGANVASYSRSTTQTHVQRREDVTTAARDAVERFGSVDFVVNTAGVLPIGSLVDTSDETIWSATEINYIAPVLIAQIFHPLLRASGGSMLLFTSSSYTRGRSGYSLYSSAKAATVNLTQALADEWAADGIRVNCINPERTGTPMRTKAFGDEPADSLLESAAVAKASLETLVSSGTGHVVDLRRLDPMEALQLGDADSLS